MRYFMMIDEKLQIAVEKSNIILDLLKKEKAFDNGMISTKRIIYIVQNYIHASIGVAYSPFSKISKELSSCGAMLGLSKEDSNGESKNVARIIVNSESDIENQRFSLVHELGHLMTEKYNFEDSNNDSSNENFKISAHINQNLFSIPKEDYEKNDTLLNEQIANVFALRVLIPFEELMKRLNNNDNLKEIADSFGVTKDAIISRLALGL